MLAIGDKVRVKANAPRYSAGAGVFDYPCDVSFGKQLTVLSIESDSGQVTVDGEVIAPRFLEPWVEGATWRDGEWHDPTAASTPAPASPTLRDQFAMAALTGFMASMSELPEFVSASRETQMKWCAADCWGIADTLLAARDADPKKLADEVGEEVARA